MGWISINPQNFSQKVRLEHDTSARLCLARACQRVGIRCFHEEKCARHARWRSIFEWKARSGDKNEREMQKPGEKGSERETGQPARKSEKNTTWVEGMRETKRRGQT